MRWVDRGFIIGSKKYGDQSLILSFFTQDHGKRRGLINKKLHSFYQISNLFHVEWHAKLRENLGFFKCELIEAPLHHFFHDNFKCIAVAAFSSILETVLPEGEPSITLYNHFQQFIDLIKSNNEFWHNYYLNLELSLLTQLGFQLDLSRCTVTGDRENLQFISPKSGRAVSRRAGEYYASKLLPFPQMLCDVYNHRMQHTYSFQEFQLALRVIGYFLSKHLFLPLGTKLPSSRELMTIR